MVGQPGAARADRAVFLRQLRRRARGVARLPGAGPRPSGHNAFRAAAPLHLLLGHSRTRVPARQSSGALRHRGAGAGAPEFGAGAGHRLCPARRAFRQLRGDAGDRPTRTGAGPAADVSAERRCGDSRAGSTGPGHAGRHHRDRPARHDAARARERAARRDRRHVGRPGARGRQTDRRELPGQPRRLSDRAVRRRGQPRRAGIIVLRHTDRSAPLRGPLRPIRAAHRAAPDVA